MHNGFLKPYMSISLLTKASIVKEAKNKLIDDTINQQLFIVYYVPGVLNIRKTAANLTDRICILEIL